MRLPLGLRWSQLGALGLGAALVLMPLWILTSDPESKLHVLRTPFCSWRMDVELTNQKGGDVLLQPDSGLRVRAIAEGKNVSVRFLLYERPLGEDWRFVWKLDAPSGNEIFYLPRVTPGMAAQVRAVDATGTYCPADSRVLLAEVVA